MFLPPISSRRSYIERKVWIFWLSVPSSSSSFDIHFLESLYLFDRGHGQLLGLVVRCRDFTERFLWVSSLSFEIAFLAGFRICFGLRGWRFRVLRYVLCCLASFVAIFLDFYVGRSFSGLLLLRSFYLFCSLDKRFVYTCTVEFALYSNPL